MAATRRRDVIGELYTSLCADPELSPSIQWRIYEYAAREKKHALMVRLLALPHLDRDLDVKLGEHDESRVRAAWIGRPGRPVGDVLDALGKARKGPVHPAAAAVPGLPVEVYRSLAEDDRGDTAYALLNNQDVPQDVKVAAATTFGARYKPKNSAYYRVERILKAMFLDQLGLLEPALSQTGSILLIKFAAEFVALSEPTLIHVVDDVITPLLEDPEPASDHWDPRTMVGAVAKLLRQPKLPAWRREALFTLTFRDYCGRNAVAQYEKKWLRDAIDDGPDFNLPEASNPNLQAVLNASTPEEVAAAARLALGQGDAELALALACNRAADAATVVSLLKLIPNEIHRALAAKRARDIDVLAAIVVHREGGWDIVSDELLAESGKPAEALIAIVREYRITGKKMPVSLGRSEFITPSVMGALPLSFTSKKGSMLARRAVAELLDTALDSPGDWKMFESLGNNFDGPLENLLLACGYVATPIDYDRQQDEPAPVLPPSGYDETELLLDPHGIATNALF